jgi:hypothetical protein
MTDKIVLLEFFNADHRPALEIGRSVRNNQPLKIVFKNNIPHLVITRVINGNPNIFVIEEPYIYPKVAQKANSDFHTKYMYLQQAKIELYDSHVKVEETTYNGFEVLRFELPDNVVKFHIIQSYISKANKTPYKTVSIHPWNV